MINGAAEPVHPARRALAGREAGALFDRLSAAQSDLIRGPEGTSKPLSCNSALLRRIAERRPATLDDIARVPGMDERRTERFGAAFLAVLSEE